MSWYGVLISIKLVELSGVYLEDYVYEFGVTMVLDSLIDRTVYNRTSDRELV